MRVLDIFKSVNKEDIAIELMKSYPNYFAKSDDYDINKENTLKTLNVFYENILNITPYDINSKEFEEYKDFIIIVNQYYGDSTYDGIDIFDLDEKTFDIEKMDKSKCEEYFYVDAVHFNQLVKNQDTLNCSLEECLKLDMSKMIITYGLDFLTRKVILNLIVAQPSIDKYGKEKVATELFWEMTFYGLTEEDIQKESDEVLDRLDSIDMEEKDIEELENSNDEDIFSGIDDKENQEEFKKKLDFSILVSRKISTFCKEKENSFLKKVLDWGQQELSL